MRSRRVISAIMALALDVFGGLVTGVSPATAAVRCAVDYAVNDWGPP
ncbi:hypothetical protein OG417_35900 [Actinoallomurus sp. NBC_01490]|jgi:hypothetical protein|nr:hypothetical protein [Actinoallomurus sp. NBC_01490]